MTFPIVFFGSIFSLCLHEFSHAIERFRRATIWIVLLLLLKFRFQLDLWPKILRSSLTMIAVGRSYLPL